MAVEEAKRLGLEVSKEGEWWWISPSFLWMTVLGMEFLDKVKAFFFFFEFRILFWKSTSPNQHVQGESLQVEQQDE